MEPEPAPEKSASPPEQGMLFAPEATSDQAEPPGSDHGGDLADLLVNFREFGQPTLRTETVGSDGGAPVPTFVNEFWTAKQRAAHPLHEVSYRACFKPALPRFFIERLSQPGEIVYDPFSGRGTTALEAALLGRVPWARDVNPLSRVLLEPRLSPPTQARVEDRLDELDLAAVPEPDDDDELLVFYHPDTLRAIQSLRTYFLERGDACDDVDRWIRMVSVNRLTGHSPGFFSVYTMPPNQAVSVEAQKKINARRDQSPQKRDVRERIARKSRSLLSRCDDVTRPVLARVAADSRLSTGRADGESDFPGGQVALVVTSPPFLDVVQYRADNWLRCWFCGIDPDAVEISHLRKVEEWRAAMTRAIEELSRLLRPGGHVAFEVGEVRGGTVRLEQVVIAAARDAGLEPELVVIHEQEFTKTANCWGIDNNKRGTNSNRIVVLRKATA